MYSQEKTDSKSQKEKNLFVENIKKLYKCFHTLILEENIFSLPFKLK